MNSLLREIRNVRQVPGELRRRWFTSETMDLIVWIDDTNGPTQLQLCYDKGRRRSERALTWKFGAGYTHTAVDDGEIGNGRYKSTPILVADGGFNTERVNNLFLKDGAELPSDIMLFVTTKIQEYHTAAQHVSYQRQPSSSSVQYDRPM
jgi:hypothetical protein